jgi:hypothetical protein
MYGTRSNEIRFAKAVMGAILMAGDCIVNVRNREGTWMLDGRLQ